MNIAQPTLPAAATVDAIPRDYNFAAAILKHNLDAGRGEKVAYIDPRGSWTYRDLAARVDSFGRALRSLDIRREERILICLLDSIDWPTAFLGAIKAGVVPVPVNTLLTEDDYRFMLEDSRARLLVVSEELYPKFAKAIGACANLAHVVVSGANGARSSALRGIAGRRRPGRWRRRRRCATTYASGSTPPARPASRRRRCIRMPTSRSPTRFTPSRSSASARPTSASRSQNCSSPTGSATRSPSRWRPERRPSCCRDRPTPELVAAILKKHRVTVFYAVPTFYAAFLASPQAPERGETRLRRCVSAGEALPADVGRRWSERYGADILDGIGSTEMLHILRLEPRRRGEIRHHRKTGARL